MPQLWAGRYGGVAALVPSRTRDLTSLALRALIAATLACLMIACVTGVFLNGDNSFLLGSVK
jgi:CNT family concentrative nucleoside transporter